MNFFPRIRCGQRVRYRNTMKIRNEKTGTAAASRRVINWNEKKNKTKQNRRDIIFAENCLSRGRAARDNYTREMTNETGLERF